METYTLEDRLGGGVGLLRATYIVESISNRSGSELAKSAAAGCNRREIGENVGAGRAWQAVLRRVVHPVPFFCCLVGAIVSIVAVVVEPGIVVERNVDEVGCETEERVKMEKGV